MANAQQHICSHNDTNNWRQLYAQQIKIMMVALFKEDRPDSQGPNYRSKIERFSTVTFNLEV